MIVISRMKDEGIVIGDNIVVRILNVTGDTVELCIESMNDTHLADESDPAGMNASRPDVPRHVATGPVATGSVSGSVLARNWETESSFANLLN